MANVTDVPKRPAVYALYGTGRDVAYVGIAKKNPRSRLDQHLIRRDSSVTTDVSVVSLDPALVVAVEWWEHPDFSDRMTVEAAELVAFMVLNPVMRSPRHCEPGRPPAC